jgi:type I restriction enzyme, S subunit
VTEGDPTFPEGWDHKRVSDVLGLRNGYPFKPTDWARSGRPIIRIQNLKSRAASYNYYTGELPDRFKAQPGDLLFAWSGTPGTSFGAHIWEGPEAWVNQHIFRVDFSDTDFDRDFLKLALTYNLADYIDQAQGGVGLAHITKAKLDQSLLVHPPLPVQRTIAQLIARHGMLHDSATSQLVDARRATERFRRAVLAAACSGRLTTDWRDGHTDALSVAQALANLRSAKRRKRAEDAPPELTVPDLPDSYTVATIGEAAEVIEYGTSERSGATTGDDIPILRMGNIQDGRLDLAELKYHALDRQIEKLLLRSGDLLFNRTNSPELVGKSAVYHGIEPMSFASYLIRVRFAPDVCDPDFANYWINSAWGRAWAQLVKTDGVSQSNINGTKLASMPLPLPPIEEQREIVRRASKLLSTADVLLGHIDDGSRAVKRTSQSILAKAFRGELLALQENAASA